MSRCNRDVARSVLPYDRCSQCQTYNWHWSEIRLLIKGKYRVVYCYNCGQAHRLESDN